MRKVIFFLSLLTLFFFAGFSLTGSTSARQDGPDPTPRPKVNICHATSSESHPYEAKQVDDDGDWHGHQSHPGDFLYFGPTKEDGKPDNEDHQADEWCENNVPTDGEQCDEGYHFDEEQDECVLDE